MSEMERLLRAQVAIMQALMQVLDYQGLDTTNLRYYVKDHKKYLGDQQR